MVNIVLQAILRANITQFLQGINQAVGGVNNLANASKKINQALDLTLFRKITEQIGDMVGQGKLFTAVFDAFALKGIMAQGAIQGMAAGLMRLSAGLAIFSAVVPIITALTSALAVLSQRLLEAGSKWESMKIGMSAVLLNTNKITSATGQQLSKTEEFNRALIVSGELMNKLRTDAAINVGTTEDLVSSFVGLQTAVAKTAKESEDAVEKTRALANRIVMTAHLLGPEVLKGGRDQAIRETNEILAGRLTIINTFARAIGLTKEEFKKLREEGMSTYDILMQRLSAYSAAQNTAARSFSGLTSTLQDLSDLAMQTMAQFGFQRVEGFLREVVDMFIHQLPNGTSEVSKGFQGILSQLAPIFDELMIPLIVLFKEFIAMFKENKDIFVASVRLLVNMLGLVLDLLGAIMPILRLLIAISKPYLMSLIYGLDVVTAGLRLIADGIKWVADNIMNFLQPVLDRLSKLYTEHLEPAIQKMLALMGKSTDLTKEAKKAQEEHQKFMDTKLKITLAGTNEELDKQNKKIQDNSQHWKNWVSTIKAAYQNRIPQLARSFLTTFGSGGTLSPITGAPGAVDVNLNFNMPDGTSMTVPAKMTPQQIAQSRSTAVQAAGVLYNQQRRASIPPSVRGGPLIQPA
jgi:hypothetical protein